MKSLIVIVAMLLTISLQAAITNVYEVQIDSANLTFQPTPDDLAQSPVTVNTIIEGAMHGVTPGDAGFALLFDSIAEGNFGTNVTGPYNLDTALFQDGISPDNDTVFHCDFNSPKRVDEIHVFAWWGDNRQFSCFDVYASITGTNDADYTKLGTMVNGEFGETNSPANQAYFRAARLYNTTGDPLMSNVTSIKLVQKNVGYGIAAGEGVIEQPGTPQGSYVAISGAAVKEIDIIGIPEPATILIGGLFLSLTFLRRR